MGIYPGIAINKKLEVPAIPGEAGELTDFEFMDSIKAVIDYSKLGLHDVLALDCDMFKLLYKKAYIAALEQTQEGRDHLKKCARLQETELDVKGFKETFYKGGE